MAQTRKNATVSDDYRRSNEIVDVEPKKFNVRHFSDLLDQTEDKGKRQKAAQALVDHLSKQYKINSPRVVVTDRPRVTKERNGFKAQTYGFYRHGSDPRGDTIVIYNTTAKTGKTVSIKSFADTLLHEFTHHYDTRYLKIKSAHTAGFYKRISSLKGKLTKETIARKVMMNDLTTEPLSKILATAQGGEG